MSAMLEEAIEAVRALPPEEQQRLSELAAGLSGLTIVAILHVLLRVEGKPTSRSDFMKTLSQLEKAGAAELQFKETPLLPPSRRATLSNRIRGKYAHIPTGSDAFARLKQEEINLEDRRR